MQVAGGGAASLVALLEASSMPAPYPMHPSRRRWRAAARPPHESYAPLAAQGPPLDPMHPSQVVGGGAALLVALLEAANVPA